MKGYIAHGSAAKYVKTRRREKDERSCKYGCIRIRWMRRQEEERKKCMSAIKTKDEVLYMLTLTGEYPRNSIHILGKNVDTVGRAIRRMRDSKLIRITKEHRNKRSIVLNRDAKTVGEPKVFEVMRKAYGNEPILNYLQVTNYDTLRYKGIDHKRLNRLHRTAEATAMMYRAGAIVEPWKQSLFDENDQPIKSKDSFYVGSKQLKQALDGYDTAYSRICGLLMSPGGAYCVYNSYRYHMRWHESAEIGARVLAADMLSRHWDVPLHLRQEEDCFDARSAIFLGWDHDIARKILDTELVRTYKTKYQFTAPEPVEPPKPETENKFLLEQWQSMHDQWEEAHKVWVREHWRADESSLGLTDVFDRMCFVPLTQDGIKQLELMMIEDWENKLIPKIFPRITKRTISDPFYKAGTLSNGDTACMCFDGNLKVLPHLDDDLKTKPDHTIQIACFDHQRPILEHMLKRHKNCKIHSAPPEPILIKVKGVD